MIFRRKVGSTGSGMAQHRSRVCYAVQIPLLRGIPLFALIGGAIDQGGGPIPCLSRTRYTDIILNHLTVVTRFSRTMGVTKASVRASLPVRRTRAPSALAARPSHFRSQVCPATGRPPRPQHRDSA